MFGTIYSDSDIWGLILKKVVNWATAIERNKMRCTTHIILQSIPLVLLNLKYRTYNHPKKKGLSVHEGYYFYFYKIPAKFFLDLALYLFLKWLEESTIRQQDLDSIDQHLKATNTVYPINSIHCSDLVDVEINDRKGWWALDWEGIFRIFMGRGVTATFTQSLILG